MFGLSHTAAATASLLLTLESAATALMAWFVFDENFDRRIALGMVSLVAGAALLSWWGTPTFRRWRARLVRSRLLAPVLPGGSTTI
jgi:drug/metabolite transporter (DMT)-like permease